MSRYYNNPVATADCFQDGWYETGDLGYRAGDRLYISGRKKDLLIIGGENYFPEDLESAVSTVSGIQPGRVCAFAQFEPRNQTEHAVIIAESTAPTASLLLAVRKEVAARFQLAHFEVHLVAPGWLIKSSAGKMARGLNRKKWADEEQR